MPLLTDIIATTGGGGVQLGDYLYARPEHFGLSGNIGSQQFVRTGFVVPYESRHASLIALAKPFAVVTSNLVGQNNWAGGTSTNYASIRHANGRYYRIETNIPNSTWGSPSQNVRYGNVLTTNATAGISAPFNTGTTVGIGDNIEFNNGINVIGYNGGNPHGMDIYRLDSGGTSFTRVYNGPAISGATYGAQMANSTSNCIAWPGGAVTSGTPNDIATSNDGVTWTARGATVNNSTWAYDSAQIVPTRVTFSTVANAYVILSANTSVVYTSNNGFNLTSRAAPVGMSATGTSMSSSALGYYANSPTVTLISLDNGKVLRVTSLTDYQIVDIGRGGYSGARFIFLWDGTQFIAIPQNAGGLSWSVYFTSPDGLTWTQQYSVAGIYAPDTTYVPPFGTPAINGSIHGVCIANNRLFMVTQPGVQGAIFDMTGRFAANTVPEYVGVPTALTFASGSSLVPYLRVS